MKQTDWPNVLLLAYCGSLLFFAVVFAIIGYLSLNSTLDWHVITYAMAIFGIAQAVTTLVVPLAMTKTSMKTAAFIVVALAMIITIATLVQRIMHTSNVGY
jgi:multisubunit Na+/H+ antiporter MnhB subunit